jgi:hypothetical protein
MSKIVLDRSKLLGFDHVQNLEAKVGKKPITTTAGTPAR